MLREKTMSYSLKQKKEFHNLKRRDKINFKNYIYKCNTVIIIIPIPIILNLLHFDQDKI